LRERLALGRRHDDFGEITRLLCIRRIRCHPKDDRNEHQAALQRFPIWLLAFRRAGWQPMAGART
jgi:hypothetical protein